MKEAKVIINIPGCWGKKFIKRNSEIYNTWGKYIKYPIITSVSNPNIKKEYLKVGNNLHCKVRDTPDHNFIYKRYYFIKWAIETNQDFDYLYLVGDDTFVYPSKFEALCNEYLNKPEIDYIGEVYPRVVIPVDFVNLQQNFVHPGAYWVFGHNTTHIDQTSVPPRILETKFKPFAGGGAGYVLSKSACQVLYNNSHEVKNFIKEFGNRATRPGMVTGLETSDDVMVAEILHKHGILLYHDNRFNHYSPRYSKQWKVRHPFIEESDSIAVCQHGREGEMQMIIDKLEISHNSVI